MLLTVQPNMRRMKHFDKFNRDVKSGCQAIPCNPFEMASGSTVINSAPFPQLVSDQLKNV